jgi:hopanoid-associated phosphorylase
LFGLTHVHDFVKVWRSESFVSPRIALVVGLKQEARAAAVPLTIVGGGSSLQTYNLLKHAGPIDAVMSFGIAGGIAPGRAAGDVILADRILSGEIFKTDQRWLTTLARKMPHAHVGAIAGVDEMIGCRHRKAYLHAKTGALAVDMESHGAARYARERGIPFVALRAVADPHHRALPHSALVGMNPDGSANVPAVLRRLARRPGDLPGLIQTAREASAAMRSLLRCRRLLGELFGFDHSVQPLLDLGGVVELRRPLFVEGNLGLHGALSVDAE